MMNFLRRLFSRVPETRTTSREPGILVGGKERGLGTPWLVVAKINRYNAALGRNVKPMPAPGTLSVQPQMPLSVNLDGSIPSIQQSYGLRFDHYGMPINPNYGGLTQPQYQALPKSERDYERQLREQLAVQKIRERQARAEEVGQARAQEERLQWRRLQQRAAETSRKALEAAHKSVGNIRTFDNKDYVQCQGKVISSGHVTQCPTYVPLHQTYCTVHKKINKELAKNRQKYAPYNDDWTDGFKTCAAPACTAMIPEWDSFCPRHALVPSTGKRWYVW